MRNNDRWISFLAWFLIGFISITSQLFVFLPWLFGSYEAHGTFNRIKDVVNHIEYLNNTINGGEVPLRHDSQSDVGVSSASDLPFIFGYLVFLWTNMNVRALYYLVPFNFSLGMLCWNYYLTMITNPGSPPLDWNPPADGSGIEYKRSTHTPRYCSSCDAYKPPRTHHCRICKKCILKMDHHCPWVHNCVGYFNYGHFVRFIIWTTISTFMCATMLIFRCMEAYENETLGIRHNLPSPEKIIFIVVLLALDCGVFLGISLLTTYHLWCISCNTTTIESWGKDRMLTIIRRGKIRDMKCPYNQGVLTNFQEVLGHNPLLWLWPKPMLGDGLRFKIRTEKKKSNMFFKSRRFSEDEDEDSGEDNTNPTGSSSSSRQHLWFRPFDGTPQHKNDEMAEMV